MVEWRRMRIMIFLRLIFYLCHQGNFSGRISSQSSQFYNRSTWKSRVRAREFKVPLEKTPCRFSYYQECLFGTHILQYWPSWGHLWSKTTSVATNQSLPVLCSLNYRKIILGAGAAAHSCTKKPIIFLLLLRTPWCAASRAPPSSPPARSSTPRSPSATTGGTGSQSGSQTSSSGPRRSTSSPGTIFLSL